MNPSIVPKHPVARRVFPAWKRTLAIGLGILSATVAVAAGALTPLSISANRRYLQDAAGKPFFLVGDSPQNLPLKFAVAEFDGYMAECAARGFNLLWICIDGQRGYGGKPSDPPPRDRAGRLMMTNGWDIGTLNPAYFETIDAALATAEKHGIYCMLTPLSECQWTQDNINRNSPEKWRAYGRFLGERYKDRANILWQFGNDKFNYAAQRPLLEAIRQAGDTHLMTINVGRNFVGGGIGSAWVMKHEKGQSWIDLNAWYRNGLISRGSAPCYWQKLEYERPDPMPSFQTEAAYQHPDGPATRANASDLYIRMQNYYVALGGGCGGHVYGAGWLADQWDYETYRDNGGRIQTKHFKELFTRREWWTLVPDYGHAFVSAGYGTLSPTTTDYVGAAINPTGTLGLAYCPKAVTITVDLAKFSGPVRARWFDPTNGAFTPIGDALLPNRGAHEFSTPGVNIANAEDWVLVLETKPALRDAATVPSPP